MWCWHPTRQMSHMPQESDHTCCCGACTAKTGFTIFIAIDIVFAVLTIITAFSDHQPVKINPGYLSPVMIVMAVLAICALKTLKPVYMQIYGVIYIIQFVFAVIFYIYAFFAVVILGIISGLATQSTEKEGKAIGGAGIAIALILFFFIMIHSMMNVWRGIVTHRFYKYVRDRQLAVEQQPGFGPKFNVVP